MDSGEELSTCAICFDAFLHPKLLSCRHTFCKPCLFDYTKKVEVDEIVCPLCRQKQSLDDRGLDGLMDNYFVSLRPPEVPIIQCCDICFEEVEVNQCHHCTQKLCRSCSSSHKLALKMSGEKTVLDLDSGDSDGSDSSEDSPLTSMHHILHTVGLSPKSKLIAELVSSFKVPFSSQDGDPMVSCIFPKSKDTCLVILGTGPEMIECTLKGRPFIRKVFNEGIHGITKTLNDKILFSNVYDGSILQMVDESQIAVFAKCDGYSPASLSTFRDGRIAAVGAANSNMEYLGKDSRNHGALLLFNKHGNLLKEMSKDRKGFLFKYPWCVSVNPQNDRVCVADREWRQVLILTEDGYVITKYKGVSRNIGGRSLGIMIGVDDFFPTAVCHDQDGNLVIANFVDGKLHILLPNGELCGFIDIKTNRGFGSPTSLCFDSENRLWVGDNHNKKVRVFEVLCFRNDFRVADR